MVNIDAIRERVRTGPRAVPSADGQFYSDVAQALADRAALLEELDRRPALAIGDWQSIRNAVDDTIETLRERLANPTTAGYEYEPDDIEWLKVTVASYERLMERLNNI